MSENQRIQQIIEPAVTDMGYEIVRVQSSGGRHPVLQIMVERVDRVPITVDDCVEVSRRISPLMDAEDPILGAYTLEVSSPGIDRPLTRLKDFERFTGHEARIETKVAIEGRRRFRGILRGVADDVIRIETPEGPAQVPFSDVLRAKLVLTDQLIAAAAGPV